MKFVAISMFIYWLGSSAALAQSVSNLLGRGFQVVSANVSGNGVWVFLRKDATLYACYADGQHTSYYSTTKCREIN